MAILGALFYFIGLILSSLRFLVGSSGGEERQAAIIQCFLVLAIALSQCAMGKDLSQREVVYCLLVWLSTTIIEWAGPRAYDNMTTGFESQIGGCDGGYRSAFLIYMSIWLSCIIFGSLLMVCEDSTLYDKDEDEEEIPYSFRSAQGTQQLVQVGIVRKSALPVIFGFCTSMSGLSFAVGAASNQLGMIFFGAVLLVLAVLSAWDWLWRLELPLFMWAALTQCAGSICRTCQTHLAFRDLRWDMAGANIGALEMQRWPGLPLFTIGFGIVIVVVTLLFNAVENQDKEKKWEDEDRLSDVDEDDEDEAPFRTYLQLTVLAFTVGCLIPGLTLPLFDAENQYPSILLDDQVQGSGGPPASPIPHNMFRVINMAYSNDLPCTALVSVFQFWILPPIMCTGNLLLILRPQWFPRDLFAPLKDEISNQATFRFMNPWMIATTMAISHFSWNVMLREIGVPEHNELINNRFGLGAYFMIGYGFFSVVLAQILSCEYTPIVRPRPSELVDDVSDDDDFYGMDTTFTAVSTSLFLIPVVGVAAYCAVTHPFITLQIRLSGIILKVVHPTLIELYQTLCFENPLLGYMAQVTFLWTLVIWLVLFLMRIPFAIGMEIDCLEFCSLGHLARRLEQIARPWVHTHLWALCFFLLFYILTGKNKAIQEVCVKPGNNNWIGLCGLAILYFGLQTLLGKARQISPDDLTLRLRKKERQPNLPGGVGFWRTAWVSCMIIFVVLFWTKGPWKQNLVKDYHDVNNKLEAMLPVLTHKAMSRIPHSSGDCIARWKQKNPSSSFVDDAAAHVDCKGEQPITHMAKEPVNVTARWIEGLDTVKLQELRITQPKNPIGPQLWNLTLSGEFTGLHIWLKVMLGGKLWINDYMCCQNPFRFSLRASAICDDEHGFMSPIKLEVAQLDPFDWKHDANWEDAMGSHISLSVDYGQKSSVQNQVREVFVSQIGNVRIRLADQTVWDPLVVAAQILQTVVRQNSGSKCPRMGANGTWTP